jgi:hypothetical protein
LNSYNQTLLSVHKAIALCEQFGVKHQRPDDYYAEMLKTDDHMLKLKDHLLAEKRRKEERSKLTKERQMKKFAKKVRFFLRFWLFFFCFFFWLVLLLLLSYDDFTKQWESL